MSDSELYRFTREEFADKPYLIELRGGEADGVRFRWHDLPPIWRQPEEPDIGGFFTESEPFCPTKLRVADYRRTGSVRDDGAHVYEFDHYE